MHLYNKRVFFFNISLYFSLSFAFCFKPSDKGKNAPALKNVEVICTVPCRSLLTPSYFHSFGMTDNYFIFVEQPLKLDILKMATAYMRGVNWASCLKFCPEENVRESRVDRKPGRDGIDSRSEFLT